MFLLKHNILAGTVTLFTYAVIIDAKDFEEAKYIVKNELKNSDQFINIVETKNHIGFNIKQNNQIMFDVYASMEDEVVQIIKKK